MKIYPEKICPLLNNITDYQSNIAFNTCNTIFKAFFQMSLTYDQILFIQDQLSNNELASDNEIENILIYEGHVPHFYIDELLSLRKLFLSNPLATLDFECNQIIVRHV